MGQERLFSLVSLKHARLVDSFSFFLLALERKRGGRNEISPSPTPQEISGFSPSKAGIHAGGQTPGSKRQHSAGRRTAHVALLSLCSLDAASNRRSFIRKSAEAARVGVAVSQSLARDVK